MDIPVEDEEIRRQVKERLLENGAIEALEQKFRFGYIQAVDAIQGEDTDEDLDYHPFHGKPRTEHDALQAIYQFLRQRGMKHTQKCIELETNAPRAERGAIDIYSLLPLVSKSPVPVNPQPVRHLDVVPSVEIDAADFDENDYIVSVDDL